MATSTLSKAFTKKTAVVKKTINAKEPSPSKKEAKEESSKEVKKTSAKKTVTKDTSTDTEKKVAAKATKPKYPTPEEKKAAREVHKKHLHEEDIKVLDGKVYVKPEPVKRHQFSTKERPSLAELFKR